MFTIVKKERLNPTVTRMVIEAPYVARKAEPGQFIIFRTHEDSERVPLTIADTDREAGTVTIIYQIVGGSTMELDEMEAGQSICDFVGPLGVATHTDGLKKVAVVGGGESAFEEAEYLSGICEKVYLIHRRDSFTAAASAVESLLKKKNVTVLKNSVIKEITGEKFVTGAVIQNRGNGSEVALPLSAVFVSIGLAPDNGAFAPVLKLDEHGYIAAGEDCLTNIEGVFAAGDTRTKALRQLVTAAADGAVAAAAAFNYVKNNF